MSAVCWLYGRQVHQALNGRPMGLIATSWGGTSIEVWMPPKALQDCNATSSEPSVSVPRNHSSLFNAMIYPFTRTVIYGTIWYQGEANAGHLGYACRFAKMIEYWRQTWNERTNGTTNIQFPFGFVQVNCSL
jgi:sialate O-acetylesterase